MDHSATSLRSNNRASYFYWNGQKPASNTLISGITIVSGSCLAIAGEQDAVNRNHAINQADFRKFTAIILYNLVHNSFGCKIVDNCLAAKFNIVIDNNLYAFDTLGSFEQEVTGIGKDDPNNLHLDAKRNS